MARTRPVDVKPGRYRPGDQLLAFLEGALIMPTCRAETAHLSSENAHRRGHKHNEPVRVGTVA